jgi:hypothetical protein
MAYRYNEEEEKNLLANSLRNSEKNNMQMASFALSGYPSNLSNEDKHFIIQRMMELANQPNNPYLSGATGFPMLLKEKYGIGR